MEAVNDLVLDYPFPKVKESLETLESIDGVTAGRSPATVRWLTPRNKYINVGLSEVDDKTCKIHRNNNSYELTDQDLTDAHACIRGHLDAAGAR